MASHWRSVTIRAWYEPRAFPTFGSRVAAPDVVRDLRARLIADGVELVEDEDEDDYVGIKCLDPDGHVVEVSWEPQ